MSLNARNVPQSGGKDKSHLYPDLDAGTFPGRLVQVIDLGLQPQKPFKGEEKKPTFEIMLTYELTDEFGLDEEGNEDKSKPRFFSERMGFYNLDSDLAKSTKRYYALDPNEECGGDWVKLLSTPCNIVLTRDESNGRVYNNIAGVSPMRAKEAEKLPALVNPSKFFSMDEPDVEVFLSLPTWIQDLIKSAINYEGGPLEKALAEYKGSTNTEKTSSKSKKAVEPEAEDDEDW